jgi:hypothetical protein
MSCGRNLVGGRSLSSWSLEGAGGGINNVINEPGDFKSHCIRDIYVHGNSAPTLS